MKRIISAVTVLVLLLCAVMPVNAAGTGSGSVIINQVYGASNDGYASHSFIELYNTSDSTVDLNGWSVQYKSSADGNDAEAEQVPPAYEGSYAAVQSKKKAIRRVDFADTDNNETDFEIIDYSKAVSEDKGPHAGNEVIIPVYTPVTTTNEKYYGFFNNEASIKAELIARYNAGAFSAEGGSAEITAYNYKNGFAYSVNGVKGTLDCVNLNGLSNSDTVNELAGAEISVARLVEDRDSGFVYGDMTSVSVSPDGSKLAVAIQDEDYTKQGRAVLFECASDGSLSYIGMALTGIQPDMVTFNEDGSLILTADEGEPRLGYSDIDPEGSVTVINVSDMSSKVIDFTGLDSEREALAAKGIVIKKDTAPSVDFEPEYIAVAGNRAFVSLQEANAIAVLDLEAGSFTGIYSAGFEDYSKVEVDLNKGDEEYRPSTYSNIKGIRMPDGIGVCVINGDTYLLTANEGDSRAWPVSTEEFVNEIKSSTSPVNGIKMDKKVTWFDVSQYDGLEPAMDYVFGGRSFTIFKVTDSGLEEVFDSGSDFEKITSSVLPEYFNCSNDVIDVEDRSGKKGPEPESVTTGVIDGRICAFVGLERIGGIMIYDITDPSDIYFENYINSRDFSDDIKNDVSPEGLHFIDAAKSPNGEAILLSSNEVSGTVSVMELKFDCVHDWDTEFTIDKEATCTEDGSKSIHCRRCGAVKDVTVIEATEHTADGQGWYGDSENHWHKCECGEILDEAAHSFGEWKITKEASANEAGSRERVCTECGYVQTEIIPEYETETEEAGTEAGAASNNNDGRNDSAKADAPSTGDNRNIIIWTVLLAVSGAAVLSARLAGRAGKVK